MHSIGVTNRFVHTGPHGRIRCVRRLTLKPLVRLLLLAILVAPLPVAADDARVRQLELDVAQLRREVMAQARRIDELERQSIRGVQRPAREAVPEAPAAAPGLPAWLVVANWERLQSGMSELEVVQVLGAPTSVRSGATAEHKTLFYALELGPKAFLAGSVELAGGRVTAVNRPVLR